MPRPLLSRPESHLNILLRAAVGLQPEAAGKGFPDERREAYSTGKAGVEVPVAAVLLRLEAAARLAALDGDGPRRLDAFDAARQALQDLVSPRPRRSGKGAPRMACCS